MQEYKKINIGKDDIRPTAERYRKDGIPLAMICFAISIPATIPLESSSSSGSKVWASSQTSSERRPGIRAVAQGNSPA